MTQHGSSLPANTEAPQRLFFALWPTDALRAALARHAASWRFSPPARASAADKLHLTLLFMDGVDAAACPALDAIGARVAQASPAFDLCLDTVAVWPGGGIAHLAPSTVPTALDTLHAALAAAVAGAGIPHDRRRFRPHVTVARRARADQAPPAFEPLRWHADSLVLVRSVLGAGRYLVLGRWPLRSD